jgi:hypothetical protein
LIAGEPVWFRGYDGGRGGIRTHEGLAPLAVFKFSARHLSQFVLLLRASSKSLSARAFRRF